jgi:processive 1,2-diacylglycerol beta-glucosyltransferase
VADKVDVLIFTASYGGGHMQAARALAEGFQLTDPAVRCALVNFMQEVSPAANRLVEVSYRQAVLRAPRLWHQFYRLTERSTPESSLERRLTRLLFPKAEALLRAYEPQVVVSTYPVSSRTIGQLKLHGRCSVPLVTVLTDQALHSQWLHPATDLYIVGSEYLWQHMLRRGIPAARISLQGIPISPRFAQPRSVKDARQALGLTTDRPVVLMMCGAQGLLPEAEELFLRLTTYTELLQPVIVTGHDTRLRMRLERSTANKQGVRILGYVTDIEEWMSASDLMVGKAGGLTTAEALAKKLPLVIVHPIPGQEEENTRFLVRSGAAVRAEGVDTAVNAVLAILADRERLSAMRQAAARVARPHAALDAAEGILSLIKLKNSVSM